jgi:hypothetical protein
MREDPEWVTTGEAAPSPPAGRYRIHTSGDGEESRKLTAEYSPLDGTGPQGPEGP